MPGSERAAPAGRFPVFACLSVVAAIVACTPPSTRAADPTPTALPTPPAHAPQLTIGLIGEISDQNVWAMFAGRSYSYNDYAIRSHYWPRLYALSIPDHRFQPKTAAGMPGPVVQEGAYYTATVAVRPDLLWSDGSPFSAADVAFTVNAALEFELGFDWIDFYDPDILDHAEAVTPQTVKFFFTRQPGVDDWQYGALQGPIVQAAYWSPKLAAASAALPAADVRASIEALKARVAALQQEADALYAETFTVRPEDARQLQADLKHKQDSLGEAINDLADAEGALQAGLDAARADLFDQSDDGEPLLGGLLPQKDSPDGTAADFVSIANAQYPLPAPNFDRIVYHTYATRIAAQAALEAGEINVLLDPEAADSGEMHSPTRSIRFLLFDVDSSIFADAALRRALACVVDQHVLAAALAGQGLPRASFIAPEEAEWHSPDAVLPCAGLDADTRLLQALEMLRSAGYAWDVEPSSGSAGQGLKAPGGSPLSAASLLAPAGDVARLAAADYVAQEARMLGIAVEVEPVTPDGINYAVLSTGKFDLAIFSWRLSAYPSYLCDWYGANGSLRYEPTALISLCGQLAVANDMAEARRTLGELQLTLAEELPLVPLYSPVVNEAPRGITYPFEALLDGLLGAYGAPNYAIPQVP